MTSLRDLRPTTTTLSLLAALTTWVTLFAWMPFAEVPSGFMGPLLFACLLVAVSGMLLRAVRVAAPLVALIQVALLAFWMHHRLAGAEALGGFLPTPDSVRAMADAVDRSFVAAQTFSAPVPASVPEFYPLMIIMGAATAVMVDFLAVGLRRAPLAGLPLLAVYTAPVSILAGGVSWPKFTAAALCFLFLITAGEDLRLSRWGQRLTPRAGIFDNERAVVGGPAVWSASRRIGLVSTGLAVVAPFLIPTITASWFDGGNGAGTGTGTGVNVTNPIVDLKRDLARGADVDLLTIKTSDPDPSYLRLSVLNSFDGQTWRPSGRQIPIKQRAAGTVPTAPGLDSEIPRKEDDATIEIGDGFSSRWLPTPYPVVSVTAPGDWRYDRTTMDFISAADNQTTAGLTYRLKSLRLSPTARELAAALPAPLSISQPGTALPRGFPNYVSRLADNVTRDQNSRFEKAVALQQWFRENGGFRYSLRRAQGNGADELVKFLSTGPDGRVGYCEQFAAAMALMGRSLGIPSRVAVGFLHPEPGLPQHLGLQLPRPPRLAGDVLRRCGLGALRADAVVEDGRRAVVHVAAGAAGIGIRRHRAVRSALEHSAGQDPGRRDRRDRQHLQLLRWWHRSARLAAGPDRSRRAAAGASCDSHPGAAPSLGRRPGRARVDRGGLARAARQRARPRHRMGRPASPLRTTTAALTRSFTCPPDPQDPAVRLPRRGPGAVPEAEEALHRMVGLLERARYSRSMPADATSAQAVAVDVDTCVAALRAGVERHRLVLARWLPASLGHAARARRATRTHRGRLISEPGVDRAV